jgi:hypothetical protein
MTTTTPCYQHPREVWIAACPDCTTWHLAAARARRDEVATASPVAHVRRIGRPEAAGRRVALLHAA